MGLQKLEQVGQTKLGLEFVSFFGVLFFLQASQLCRSETFWTSKEIWLKLLNLLPFAICLYGHLLTHQIGSHTIHCLASYPHCLIKIE